MDEQQLARRRLIRNIDVVIAGVNGVFTDNRELEGAPFQAKWRSHYDGQGVSLLRAIGIKVLLITNEEEEKACYIRKLVERWNNKLPSAARWPAVEYFTGIRFADGLIAVENFLRGIDSSFNRCAGMEHDLFFKPLLERVTLPAAPITAEPLVKDYVLSREGYISLRPAGQGAFRDLVNFILECRGINPFLLSPE